MDVDMSKMSGAGRPGIKSAEWMHIESGSYTWQLGVT